MSRVGEGAWRALCSHAVAAERWPELGVCDHAAREWVRRLGKRPVRPDEPERQRVVRSAWIDRRCRIAIARYPRLLGVNLGAMAFNTRFHRLSQADDWPRFRWLDVHTAGTPVPDAPWPDHYRALAAPPADWLGAIQRECQSWQGPLLVVAESAGAHWRCGQWRSLLDWLARRPGPVELIGDYLTPVAALRQRLRIAGLGQLYPTVRFHGRPEQMAGRGWQCLVRMPLATGRADWLPGQWYASHWRWP